MPCVVEVKDQSACRITVGRLEQAELGISIVACTPIFNLSKIETLECSHTDVVRRDPLLAGFQSRQDRVATPSQQRRPPLTTEGDN